MNFYTKEWYELMQRQHYTSGLKVIPDKVYSNKDIKTFYSEDLEKEIARDKEFHNRRSNKHPFDPAETIKCFHDCYRGMLRYGAARFPEWVLDTVDKRLLALGRIPERAHKRLKQEEQANRKAFNKIEAEAAAILEQQDIPDAIRSQFCFHDANVLAIKKVRFDVELYLRKDGGWPEDNTPYIKIIFKNVRKYEREKGFSLRPRLSEHGELGSGCVYLYDELYRNEDGYEVHMLFWTRKSLRYLTIHCEDIQFQDNIPLESVPQGGVST